MVEIVMGDQIVGNIFTY